MYPRLGKEVQLENDKRCKQGRAPSKASCVQLKDQQWAVKQDKKTLVSNYSTSGKHLSND
jgi:hypothetical protein